MSKHLAISVALLALSILIGCSSTQPCPAPSAHRQPDPLPQNTVAPSVRLNYIYLTLDAETLDAINQSQFIRDRFALFGQSTPEPSTSKAAPATYLLGQTTCLELSAAPKAKANTEGYAGICFSTSETGQINVVYENLFAKLGANVQKGASTFDTGTEQIPWFRYVNSHTSTQTPPLLTWVTEHDPTFHKAIGPNSDCRLSEPQKQQSQKLFRNITSITLDLTQAEFDHLNAELSAYGYARTSRQGMTVFSAPDIEIHAAVSEQPKYRIRVIRCSLSAQPKSPAQMSFGDKATLTFTEDAAATWTFGPRQTHFARK